MDVYKIKFLYCFRTDIEELEQKLMKEREKYHNASLEDGYGFSAIPFFSVNDKVHKSALMGSTLILIHLWY